MYSENNHPQNKFNTDNHNGKQLEITNDQNELNKVVDYNEFVEPFNNS